MNFFMEVAKLRAARVLWHRVMTKLGAQDERSKMLRTHCQTSGVSLQEQDPYNNVIRTTIEAMAAMLGGTQSLHTNALDEAIALPTDFSARIARNTQIVIQEETGMCNVVDPLGGSYYIESLTQSLVDQAWEIIERVEAEGGMAKAVAAGWPKAMIETAAAARQARVDRGDDVIVGVNKYRLGTEDRLETLEVDNAKVREGQIARINAVKAARNEDACQAALGALTEGARGGGNLLALAVKPPAPAPRWAKFLLRWKRSSVAMRPCRPRYKASMPPPIKGTRVGVRCSTECRPSSTAWAANPGCWSPKWGRTGMIAARTSLRRPSRTWASKSSPARCSRRRRKRAIWRWRAMSTSSARRRSPRGTRP
jgi:methylmalonyl-CoA mutase